MCYEPKREIIEKKTDTMLVKNHIRHGLTTINSAERRVCETICAASLIWTINWTTGGRIIEMPDLLD